MSDTESTHIRHERRDAAENRQRILTAAIHLFEQNGVENVSMNQIAIEAQVGPGTLYRRYRNKSELCLDLIKDNIVILFDNLEMYLEQNRHTPPGQRLKELVRLFIRFRESKSQLLRGVEDVALTNRVTAYGQGPLYHDMHRLMVQLFDEMNMNNRSSSCEGKLPDSVFQADMLLLALRGDSYLYQKEVRGHSSDTILAYLCATFMPKQDQA